jgi:hypothetical protein
MKSFNIPDKILFEAIKQKTNEKKLHILINFLQKNLFKTSLNNDIIERISFYSWKKTIASSANTMLQVSKKPTILADLESIYNKLRDIGMLKINEMKPCSKVKVLL